MKNDYQTNAIKELKNALVQLGKQTLPVRTRALIQSAQKQIKQLEHSLEQDSKQGRLAALYRVSRSLGDSLNLDDVLNQVMDAVIQLTHAERGFLTLVDPDSGKLKLRAARNIQQENLQREDLKVSRTVIQSVVKSGKGVVATDAQDDPRFAGHESIIIYALRSILCAPLRVGGQIIGVIYVDNRARSGIFTDKDLDLLNAFASQAAVAIENARLYTRTDQALAARVSELETLSQIDQELNAQLDLQRVLDITLEWVIEETDATQGWIALLDMETSTPYIVAGHQEGSPFTPDQKLLSRIRTNPSAQIVLAHGNAPVYFIVPLLHAGETIGAVIVAHPKAFSDEDQQFLARLAGRASAAVENAQLYQAVEQANQAKSQFVSIVTHELRIPLTSIKGYTDLILQGAVGDVNDQQANFLGVIHNNTDRMSALISDLSDISRIERGKLKLEPDFISLNDHVTETLNSLRHKLEEKSLSLETHLPSDLDQV
ncbi:MAG: GAF domain-containing protein, partial [Chloroflexota bacterium]|nr:GAF domain-containing protein [Chloroflexota bacterium]